MADVNARTRLLIGTTAAWAANDLVLGDGELVLERAGTAIKMKAGDGATHYSGLPFVSADPVIPPTYYTVSQNDARYLQLSGIATTATPNAVPRMLVSGLLDPSMIPLPPAIDHSIGTGDAGKLVKTAASGKIDPTLITATTGKYRGTTDLTQPVPTGTTYLAGDYFVNIGTGAAHGTWGFPGGTNVLPTQQAYYNGASWDLIGAGTSATLRLADGTAALPSLAFANDATLGLFRPGANLLGFAVSGAEKARLTASASGDAQFLVGQQVPQFGATGRGLIEINGASSAGISLNQGGTATGYLFSNTSETRLATLGATPLTFQAQSIEKMRLPQGADAQLLLGLTAPQFGASGRGLIEINGTGTGGTGTATLGFDIQGTATGYLNAQTTLLTLGSVTNIPIAFATYSAERARVDGNGNWFFGMSGIPNVGSPITLARYNNTAAPNDNYSTIGFVNRGLNGTDPNTYGVGGLLAGGFRDINPVAYIAGITFERAPAAGGLASAGSIVFKTDPQGIASANSLIERARIDGNGVFTYGGLEIGYRDIPQNVVSPGYTVQLSDRGKMVVLSSGAGAINVPTTMPVGSVFSIFNNAGGPAITIQGGINIVWGTGSPGYVIGPRSLAFAGIATLYVYAANYAVIKGDGLS